MILDILRHPLDFCAFVTTDIATNTESYVKPYSTLLFLNTCEFIPGIGLAMLEHACGFSKRMTLYHWHVTFCTRQV